MDRPDRAGPGPARAPEGEYLTRLFLAIDLDSSLRARLESLARDLRPLARSARWLPVEGLHLTVRFFGETADPGSLAVALERSLHRARAFSLRFAGGGVFPDRRRARVFWVGVIDPPRELFDLHAKAEAAAREAGFDPQPRRYEPHLTIARFRGREAGIGALLEAASGRDLGRLAVTEAILFESRLCPEGASYREVARFPLVSAATGGTPENG